MRDNPSVGNNSVVQLAPSVIEFDQGIDDLLVSRTLHYTRGQNTLNLIQVPLDYFVELYSNI